PSRAIPPKANSPPKPPCSSTTSSCANSTSSLTPAEPLSSYPTAHSSATASAHGSRRNCSKTSISTPSSACPTEFSPPTPASRPTSCSSTAPIPPKKFGTTNSHHPRAGRITPRPNPFSSKNSPAVSNGGTTAKKTIAPGNYKLRICWNTIPTDL